MLSKKMLKERVQKYEELKAQMAVAQAELDAIEAELKAELNRRKVEELEVGEKKVKWTRFVKSQFDSKGFRAENPDVYKKWQKQVEQRRFSVA